MSENATRCRVVLCTCPDAAIAQGLATGVVEAGLAACVNVVDEIRSIYRWQGAVQDESEALMIIKTMQSACPALERWLVEHHPYDVPEVLVLPVAEGSEPYLDWIRAGSGGTAT